MAKLKYNGKYYTKGIIFDGKEYCRVKLDGVYFELCEDVKPPILLKEELYIGMRNSFLGRYDGEKYTNLGKQNDDNDIFEFMVVFMDLIYFSGNKKLFKYNGTDLVLVKEFDKNILSIEVFNGKLYIAIGSSDLTILFKYDGKEIINLKEYDTKIQYLKTYQKNLMIFYGKKIEEYNGTKFEPIKYDDWFSTFKGTEIYNEKIYFIGTNGKNERTLYTYDGIKIIPLPIQKEYEEQYYLKTFKDSLHISYKDGRLVKYNELDFVELGNTTNPIQIAEEFNGYLYFVKLNYQKKLLRYDGKEYINVENLPENAYSMIVYKPK